MSNNKTYVVETAKSGRSTCRRCKLKIDSGDLRFGCISDPETTEYSMTFWYHVDCASGGSLQSAINKYGSLESIPGVKDCDALEQVQKALEKGVIPAEEKKKQAAEKEAARAREKAEKAAEKEAKAAEKAREKEAKAAEKAREKEAKAAEKAREKAEKAAEKAREKAEKAAEKAREKEASKKRKDAESDAAQAKSKATKTIDGIPTA